MTVSDTAGNDAEVTLTFPAVAKGDQTLTNFGYTPAMVTFGDPTPTLNAPDGAENALSYTAEPATVCEVGSSSGALTLIAVGTCEITATAAASDDYHEGTATTTVTVLPKGTLALNLDTIAGDDTVNIAEKAAGFAITGDTGTEAGVSVSVTIGTQTTLTASSTAMGDLVGERCPRTRPTSPARASQVTVSASKTGFTAPSDVTRTLTVDLTAPTAPSYTTPTSLKVGEAMTDIGPSGGSGIDEYAAAGLPSGLAIDATAGVIGGTPDTATTSTASITVTVSDTAGNDADVTLTFPAVAKGDQTLTNFGYSPASVLFGDPAPTFNAPDGAENALSYTAEPPEGMLGRFVERGVDPHRGGNVRDHRDGRGERRLQRGHRHHHGHRAAQGDACPQPRHHRRGRHREHRREGGGVQHHRGHRNRGRRVGDGDGGDGGAHRVFDRHGDLVGGRARERHLHHRHQRHGDGLGFEDRVHRRERRDPHPGRRSHRPDRPELHHADFAQGG